MLRHAEGYHPHQDIALTLSYSLLKAIVYLNCFNLFSEQVEEHCLLLSESSPAVHCCGSIVIAHGVVLQEFGVCDNQVIEGAQVGSSVVRPLGEVVLCHCPWLRRKGNNRYWWIVGLQPSC